MVGILRRVVGTKPKSKVRITLEGRKIIVRAGGMGLKEFLRIIPPEKRKKLKVKDVDEWYEGEVFKTRNLFLFKLFVLNSFKREYGM